MNSHEIARRRFLRAGLGGLLGVSSCGWLPNVAQQLQAAPNRRRQCILLWMSGGPSQIDTFDLKPDHQNGGEFKEISTRTPGLRISEHLPLLAEQSESLAIVRGVSTREGDHQRGTYLMRTGQRPGSPIPFPCIGSALTKSLARPDLALPNYLSINPVSQISPEAFSPGFLGPRYAAATVGASDAAAPSGDDGASPGFADLKVDHLHRAQGVDESQAARRIKIWNDLQSSFLKGRPNAAIVAQDTVYRRAIDMMQSADIKAFDLSEEPQAVREAYGRGRFGQGCLMARRLIEQNVPMVEVTLGEGLGWDTHQNNFEAVRRLSSELDQGWGTLMSDLRDRGLLETTTILWMGEFGRTPQINGMGGRDHFPNAWSCVFAGGGIKGGQAFGRTSDDGREVSDGKVAQGDVLATLCAALGIDPDHENYAADGRPHKIADGQPIETILA